MDGIIAELKVPLKTSKTGVGLGQPIKQNHETHQISMRGV